MPAWLTVVGIGDDGFAGLGRPARRALLEASVIYGGERHLSMLPARLAARRVAWPRPFDLAPLLAERGRPVCVLASGDPMLFGVGATLARRVPPDALRVLPAPSSGSLAAARLGWPLQEVATVSLVGRPLASVNAYLYDGARVFVLSADGGTPAALAALLNARGFGATCMSVLEHLGGEAERRIDGRADQWSTGEVAALNLIALECRATAGAPRLPLTCGLPDDAFRHDGQLTKRDVRAITLARLAPTPGQLLWDVGAGSGSIGIEWMRAHPACRAIAIESHAERQGFIGHNRDALGVPGLQLVAGRAPQALEGLPAPDAVFIGGGVTVPGVLEACWASLRDGGRLVANAVTLQGEAVLAAWRERQGGTLTRIALADAQPLGGFDTWRQALPITLYEAVKVSGGNDAARDRNRAASAESAESA
ncbi:Precorrin-6Y C(5,15)-methyltransferase [decarboxylating] [Paraburkholderia phenoliruptrix]|uniref:Precorrin-6Y C(5,15)-methyltransferase [decarboxylating] n=1 Tax=Paraburkholderia phenoliruptrix TaxID=252970 RepID=A0A6J5AI22_9BURK|nr:bifunctional cobalt-precorrin-7 (C(5))-methyltransferase/cobalt-precorrin-6B (C(15))-methyltransferase [Paraburkholderia phenoliruptrix]CAB3668891.1 Precorrin-6Y C(5,15)-methyltransferase [decarboxylating] [Paraburkholderia phenoliruptrix]